MTCRFVDGQGKRGNVHIPVSCRSLSLMMSCLTVSFCCGVVYSRGNRTPESEKRRRRFFVYVPGTYISPFVVALAAGVNSNPSSREVLLEDGKSETGPKPLHTLRRNLASHSSTPTGGRHKAMQQQTGSEPPNRCPPDLLVNTYTTHSHS